MNEQGQAIYCNDDSGDQQTPPEEEEDELQVRQGERTKEPLDCTNRRRYVYNVARHPFAWDMEIGSKGCVFENPT